MDHIEALQKEMHDEIRTLESSSAAEPSTSPESGTPERQSIIQQARNINSGSAGVANT